MKKKSNLYSKNHVSTDGSSGDLPVQEEGGNLEQLQGQEFPLHRLQEATARARVAAAAAALVGSVAAAGTGSGTGRGSVPAAAGILGSAPAAAGILGSAPAAAGILGPVVTSLTILFNQYNYNFHKYWLI